MDGGRTARWLVGAVVVVGSAGLLAGCAGDKTESEVSAAEQGPAARAQAGEDGGAAGVDADAATDASREEWEAACGDAPPDTSCGVTFEELRAMNMRYAERMDFSGDLADAGMVVGVVRQRLEPVAAAAARPTEDQVREALDGLPAVQTSTNAVGLSGTAFAVAVDGGCVFGSVLDGVVTVQIGGYVNDGGCLASYGH